MFRYDGHMLWIPNIKIEESGTYACHSEITCGPRFLKLIPTKCSTATIYDLYFVINFPVLFNIIYVCSASDRQCRLSSLYRKRNVRRKTFKESLYSDSNFTYTKNRNRFIQTPNIWPSRPVTLNEIGDIDKVNPKDTTSIILLFPKFPRY